ncbi:putative Copine [Zostera marina]|uniref:Putative Copine n=1 Tax=Zostera marina TaxID=29655 RepID=A0A0K9NV53_ZOSMR|nr:putative Copine [Zostera marina]
MGGSSSKKKQREQTPHRHQPEYPNTIPQQPYYPPQGRPPQSYSSFSEPYPPPQPPQESQNYIASTPLYQPHPQKNFNKSYSKIADNYRSLDQVSQALLEAGLESSNIIVGIDFTKSNEWTGKLSFNRLSLHHIGNTPNPYEQAIYILGKTMSMFDDDNLIPCFGFGDGSTHDQDVFGFYEGGRPCNGFEEVLSRYRDIVPHLRLSGPTSFAPIIEMGMSVVEQSGGQYHVLLIIADGQVTRSVDIPPGQMSIEEQRTIDAIVQASNYPMSIVLVGVGDGPWDMMREFDDNIPHRSFDNFQFVNFTDIMSKNVDQSRKESEFALAALMEIPLQYRATMDLGLLSRRTGNLPERLPLPPPHGSYFKNSQSTNFLKSTLPDFGYGTPMPAYNAPIDDNHICPICLSNSKDMAFNCGHQTCCECGKTLDTCPICRSNITSRIKLY